MHPKIGIIICGFNENRQFCTKCLYSIRPLRQRNPSPHPSCAKRQDDRWLCKFMRRISLCGGEDITPSLFGEEPQNGNGKTDITVDLFKFRSHEARSGFPKPRLLRAICRGMQILNVSCGGTIWQDLSLIPQPTLNHTQQSASRGDVSHRIKIERCSSSKQFVGSCIYVKQFPPSICQNTREKRLCQRPFPGRRHWGNRTFRTSFRPRSSMASRVHVSHLAWNAFSFSMNFIAHSLIKQQRFRTYYFLKYYL